MKLLAIDTASSICSVALFINGEILLEEKRLPQGHSEHLLSMANILMAKAECWLDELDAIAFGCGPGSFTGLRIAAGATQGIAFGADLRVIPISNLAALALNAIRKHGSERVLTAFDARMNEIYWAGYRADEITGVRLEITEAVIAPEHAEIPEQHQWIGVGEGWKVHHQTLANRCQHRLESIDDELQCSAREIALLAVQNFESSNCLAPDKALPVYLRNHVANKPASPR